MHERENEGEMEEWEGGTCFLLACRYRQVETTVSLTHIQDADTPQSLIQSKGLDFSNLPTLCGLVTFLLFKKKSHIITKHSSSVISSLVITGNRIYCKYIILRLENVLFLMQRHTY
ncbi:hypothetical protein PAMP_013088 [Pampus punctatissimus]